MLRGRGWVGLAGLVVMVLVAGCTDQPPQAEGGASTPASVTAVEYNLGEATITQQGFDEGSKFRDMPVRLNGMIAVPSAGEGPFPVVMVLHGTHPGCPTDEGGVDRWPCDPEVEQANYAGFAYLLESLAEQGYVALAPNLNAENTFGFGEPRPGERLKQLTDLHLGALAQASDGGAPDFGVDLAGRADPTQLALIGHSRGGEAAVALAGDPAIVDGSAGFGPVAGTLLVAAATTFRDPWTSIGVPVGTILAGCDGDVTDQTGQFFYEGPRLAPDQVQWVASTFLEGASHNGFNKILPPDMVDQSERADCRTPLTPERQQQWLADYAGGFLDLVFSDDAQLRQQVQSDLGLAVGQPAPDEVLGLPARIAYLAPAADRTGVFVPAEAADLTTNALGGGVSADGLDLQFCPKGFYTVDMEPGTEACHRATVTVPGQPALAVAAWESGDAALRLAVPAGQGDLSAASALRLRAAVNPASALNPVGAGQALTIRLTDRSGASASVTTAADEPALRYPAGEMRQEPDSPAFFTGIVPFTDVRVPLSEFGGVNLADLAEVAIVMDRTPSGSLFLGDVEFLAG